VIEGNVEHGLTTVIKHHLITVGGADRRQILLEFCLKHHPITVIGAHRDQIVVGVFPPMV